MSCLKAIFQGNDKSCKKWQRRAIEWSNENLILVKKKKGGGCGEEQCWGVERSPASLQQFGGWPGAIAHPGLRRLRPDVPTARRGPCQLTAPCDNRLSGCPSLAAEIELNDDDLPTSWERKQCI